MTEEDDKFAISALRDVRNFVLIVLCSVWVMIFLLFMSGMIYYAYQNRYHPKEDKKEQMQHE